MPVNQERRGPNLVSIPSAPKERLGTLAAITEREARAVAMTRLPARAMAPIGPFAGQPEMIRLGDLPGVEKSMPGALRILGADHLVPKDPDAPEAQRTIFRSFSWGSMGTGHGKRETMAQRAAREKAATKKAKKQQR